MKSRFNYRSSWCSISAIVAFCMELPVWTDYDSIVYPVALNSFSYPQHSRVTPLLVPARKAPEQLTKCVGYSQSFCSL